MRRSALPLACGLLAAGLVTVPSPTPVGATLPASCSVPTSTGHQPSFTYLGRYTVGGLPSGETAAEIVAQEGARLYVMNVASLDIVNIGDPIAAKISGRPTRAGGKPIGKPHSVVRAVHHAVEIGIAKLCSQDVFD